MPCLAFQPLSNQVAKVQEELKKEKERTGNVSKKAMSAIKKRYEKDNREEVDKQKKMFRAALSRAQMAEKRLEETRVELSKLKDMRHEQFKVPNSQIDENKDDEVHVLKVLNKQVRDEKKVLQKEIEAQEEENKKLCHEKEILQTEVAALQEKVNLTEVLNAEASLSRHLENERIAFEIVAKQEELINMGEKLSDSNKSLLTEVKQGFESMMEKITAPMDARLKNFDEKVSELVSNKQALEGGLEKGFRLEELTKLKNNRIELTKMVERLTAALKVLKEEKAEVERELKNVQEKAAGAEKKQNTKSIQEKEGLSAKVKMLIAEKGALRKDVMALAADVRQESEELHADKAEEHHRVVEKLEKEKRHLEARLEEAQLSLVMERKKTVVEQLVAQSSKEHLASPSRNSQGDGVAVNTSSGGPR